MFLATDITHCCGGGVTKFHNHTLDIYYIGKTVYLPSQHKNGIILCLPIFVQW